LPAPFSADQRDELAASDVERDVVERDAVGVRLGDAAELECRGAHRTTAVRDRIQNQGRHPRATSGTNAKRERRAERGRAAVAVRVCLPTASGTNAAMTSNGPSTCRRTSHSVVSSGEPEVEVERGRRCAQSPPRGAAPATPASVAGHDDDSGHDQGVDAPGDGPDGQRGDDREPETGPPRGVRRCDSTSSPQTTGYCSGRSGWSVSCARAFDPRRRRAGTTRCRQAARAHRRRARGPTPANATTTAHAMARATRLIGHRARPRQSRCHTGPPLRRAGHATTASSAGAPGRARGGGR